MTDEYLANITRQLSNAELAALVRQRDSLLRHKDFVHHRLDQAGIDPNPNGPHSKEGCRIGDRLDIALAGRLPLGATEGKYGTIYCSGKTFHPDEPVFLFRATDPFTHDAIMEYVEYCRKNGCSREHVETAFAHANRILAWQQAHPELVKRLPD